MLASLWSRGLGISVSGPRGSDAQDAWMCHWRCALQTGHEDRVATPIGSTYTRTTAPTHSRTHSDCQCHSLCPLTEHRPCAGVSSTAPPTDTPHRANHNERTSLAT
eukprot:Blabericola_migrator_1__5429@NODE_2777_length_2366_cov_835_668987_g1739_i0_p2_GENE_NODE_2777_length_2366_cov_835_668987_g1739_i0NODE_2777_length_2366_cov_835_668987_g1739_i0_p2_ORF_typecomplete_len106_score2_70CarbpepA_inh/PF02977_15/3_7CarbpepA_inh/PF02977_15/18_NODE_2777_length_2366_cov_835_668987_g1739_i0108425